jgi:integrase
MDTTSRRLTDATVKLLPTPAKGNRISYDAVVKGFGARVTAAGARAFVLNYRTRAGRERRFTIGSFPDWTTAAARAEAAELKRRVDRGEDPLSDIETEREAPAVADLAARFEAEHVVRKRESTAAEYRSMLRKYILPALGSRKVAAVTFTDVDRLHHKISESGKLYRANRVLATLSKMFALAIRWQWRSDNPARGIERNPEAKRTRYLSGGELARLAEALAAHDDQQAANVVRLLLLTGARRGEVLSMRWDHLDMATGVWTKPGATTKQKTEHRVPLSEPARLLLGELRARADGAYVFPSYGSHGHRHTINKNWAAVCRAANIDDARLHDLRHTFASVLVSSGLSLPIIGALLGHTQPATTHRYAHLSDDPLRAATERVGAIVMPARGDV